MDVGELLKVLKNVSTCFQFQLENLLGIFCTVIKAFAGLAIVPAIAGNITSYCRKMFAHLITLL